MPRSENSVIAAEKFGIKHFIFVGLFVDQVDRLFHMGNVKINFISWEESAVAIVKLAMSPALQGKTYILTQDRNYTMLELADLLSEISGHEISYQPVTVEEFAALYDQPKGFGIVLASLYQAGSQGCLGIVTDDFRTITGRQATDLKSYMMKNYQG